MDNERDFTTTDLPDDGTDRFNEFAMGVKKKFRPDWLDSENSIFINKLNFITNNFEETQKTVKSLKNTVYNNQKLAIEELEVKSREILEEHTHTRGKLDSMENNLPRMIREMIDYYADQKLNKKFDLFVTKRELRDQLSVKMDYAIFNDYCRQQQNDEALNDKEFKTDERLFLLEKRFDDMSTKEDLKNQMKTKVSNERFIELRENMHKL